MLDIQRLARDKGVESLREDAVRKVLDGSTSYLELLRATVVCTARHPSYLSRRAGGPDI